jgi:hypothetical protein
VLQLPKAEIGLSALSDLFTARLSPELRSTMPAGRRIGEEEKLLLELLEGECDIDASDAAAIVDEVYNELAVFLGPLAPRRIDGIGAFRTAKMDAKDADAADAEKLKQAQEAGRRPSIGTAMIAEAMADKGGTGNKVIDLHRYIQKNTELEQDGSMRLKNKALMGTDLGGLVIESAKTGHDSATIFFSELGFVVLFCSPRFVTLLAQRDELTHTNAIAAVALAGQDKSTSASRGSLSLDGKPSAGASKARFGGSPVRVGPDEHTIGPESSPTRRFFRRSWQDAAVGAAESADVQASPPASPSKARAPRGQPGDEQQLDELDGTPVRSRSIFRRSTENKVVPLTTASAEEGRGSNGGGSVTFHLTEAQQTGLDEMLANSAFVVNSLFKVFDIGRRGRIRIRDVRNLQAKLGEMVRALSLLARWLARGALVRRALARPVIPARPLTACSRLACSPSVGEILPPKILPPPARSTLYPLPPRARAPGAGRA